MTDTFANASEPEAQQRTIERDGMTERYASVGGGVSLSNILRECATLKAGGTLPVYAEVFAPAGDDTEHLATGMGDAPPVTWVLPESSAPGIGGQHLKLVADAPVRLLTLDGASVGSIVEGPYADEVTLAGIHATDVSASRPDQARKTFERIEAALALADMDFSHVARTWLYLDDILSWYPDFNCVRTQFFTERGVFDRMVPASTGIGGSNPFGAAMIAGAYAVRAKSPAVKVQALPSPLQCPALDYGSSFSRAVEVQMPDLRRLMISGTAGIDPDGNTAHVGDVAAQTALTCDVVEAILVSRGMGWEDVTRATAYVRHADDAGVFERHRASAAIPPLPVIVAHNVICRQDLLFELEVDAARPGREETS